MIRTGSRRISDLQLAGEHGAGEGDLCTQCPKSQFFIAKGAIIWLFAVLQIIMAPSCRQLQERLT